MPIKSNSNNGVSEIYVITAPDGSHATVHSQGGHVTSWVGAAGDERLFLSPANKIVKGKPIRGGVPIIFPQFSDMGTGPTHGCARNRQFVRIDDGATPGKAVFAFEIKKGDKEFPNTASTLELTVAVSDEELRLECAVKGHGKDVTIDSEFGLLFHTYFAVSDVSKVRVEGFEGKTFANGLKKRVEEKTSGDFNAITGVVDSIFYNNNSKPLRIVDAALGRTFEISGSDSCPDVVLWNPGPQTIAKFGDLPQPNGYKGFLCIEHGAIGPKAKFPANPSDVWVGRQTIRCVKHSTTSLKSKL